MSVDLMSAFDFSVEDLSANKSGQLSARQLERLAKADRKQKITLAIFGTLGVAIGTFLLMPVILGLTTENKIGFLVGGVIVGGLGLLFLSGLFDKPRTDISVTQGKAQFVSRESSTHDEDGGVTYHTSYYVVIGGKDFQVKSSQYEAFNQGHVYTVYHAPHPLNILSIEYVGPPPEGG